MRNGSSLPLSKALACFGLFVTVTTVASAGDKTFQNADRCAHPSLSWTGVYLGLSGGTGWGNNAYTWNQDATLAAVAAQMPNPGAPPPLARRKDRSRSVEDISAAKLAETGRSSGPSSESKPTLIGLTSRATAVASMRVRLPPPVSALLAMIKFRASALSQAALARQLIAR